MISIKVSKYMHFRFNFSKQYDNFFLKLLLMPTYVRHVNHIIVDDDMIDVTYVRARDSIEIYDSKSTRPRLRLRTCIMYVRTYVRLVPSYKRPARSTVDDSMHAALVSVDTIKMAQGQLYCNYCNCF